MATPPSRRRTQTPPHRRQPMQLVRPPHVQRPHQELGLQPRLHQPRQRQTPRTPRVNEQSRSHPPRPTHPTTRRATPRNMQHPIRRRRQQTPRSSDQCRHTTRTIRTDNAMAMANRLYTVMHCNTTAFDIAAHAKDVALQSITARQKNQTPPGYASRDERHGIFFHGADVCCASKLAAAQRISGGRASRNVLQINGFQR